MWHSAVNRASTFLPRRRETDVFIDIISTIRVHLNNYDTSPLVLL